MECTDKECSGSLVKLKEYYVCNICCKDTVTFKEVIEIAAAERNVLVDKPKGKSIQLKHPEYAGFYPYEIIRKSTYIKTYKLFGIDGSKSGALVVSDYSKSKMITYSGPKYLSHMVVRDQIQTASVAIEDIIFHSK